MKPEIKLDTNSRVEFDSPGATQIHPKVTDNREDHDVGGDLRGEVVAQHVNGRSQRIGVRGHDGAARGRFRRVLDRPERNDRDRL